MLTQYFSYLLLHSTLPQNSMTYSVTILLCACDVAIWAGLAGDGSPLFHVTSSEGWLAQLNLDPNVWGLGSHCCLSSSVLQVVSPGAYPGIHTAPRWPQDSQAGYKVVGFPPRAQKNRSCHLS